MPTSPRTKNNLDNIFDFSEIIQNEQQNAGNGSQDSLELPGCIEGTGGSGSSEIVA